MRHKNDACVALSVVCNAYYARSYMCGPAHEGPVKCRPIYSREDCDASVTRGRDAK